VSRVYVVDDEEELRRALARVLSVEGLAVTTFASAAEFLSQLASDTVGCCVLDVAMPGLDGLELQERIAASDAQLEVVFLTGRGDIPTSVRAMKAGAVDFLTKPVARLELLRAVHAGLDAAHRRAAARESTAALRERFGRLTPREREVMRHVVAGKLNKVIAAELGTTEHTVKVHRGRVMEKLDVASVAELVRAASALGVTPP
jgi:FixJ family two-component response regulator